jgi:hypothetical protein
MAFFTYSAGWDRRIAEAVAHALPGQVKVSAIESAYICRL